MKKSAINPYPQFFDRYINLVEQDDLFDAFQTSLSQLKSIDLTNYNKIADKRYQPEKWTVKDIFQHIIDNERIQSYRALWFARMDTTELPGYDENLFGQNAKTAGRTLEDLLDELKTLRTSVMQLFRSFDEADMMKNGVCFGNRISVTALGFMIIGHQIHHLRIIDERYMVLL
jgi:hypothetical protein